MKINQIKIKKHCTVKVKNKKVKNKRISVVSEVLLKLWWDQESNIRNRKDEIWQCKIKLCLVKK